jgi:hypothetical protein
MKNKSFLLSKHLSSGDVKIQLKKTNICVLLPIVSRHQSDFNGFEVDPNESAHTYSDMLCTHRILDLVAVLYHKHLEPCSLVDSRSQLDPDQSHDKYDSVQLRHLDTDHCSCETC